MLTRAVAREMGAGARASRLAGVLAAVPGVWWVVDHQLAMNAFEPLFWTGLALVLLAMIRTGERRLWLVFGLVAGVGLENKYSITVWAFALLAGLLVSRGRHLLASPWLLAGGAVALVVFLPNLLWNVRHGWPFLELMRNIRASGRDVVLSPVRFLAEQALILNPVTLPIWLAGLGYLCVTAAARPYRALGWAFAITIAFFLLAHGKNYYTAPAYPVVLAAGAIVVERVLNSAVLAHRPGPRRVLEAGVYTWLLAGVVLLLPVVLPVLPVDAYLRYQAHLPFPVPHSEHSSEGAPLPQHYADEFGWPEMAGAVAGVYWSLPPEDRSEAAIFTSNYGEAAAIDFFGPKYGLPGAICPHQSYFLWGPGHYTGRVVIRVGSTIEGARSAYARVDVAASVENPHALPFETRPILLCRGRRINIQLDWPRLKNWD